MANLTVTREIEVKVNINEVNMDKAYAVLGTRDFTSAFNIILDDPRVRVAGFISNGESLSGTVYLTVKGKKHEPIVDEVVSIFKQYVEDALLGYIIVSNAEQKVAMARINRGLAACENIDDLTLQEMDDMTLEELDNLEA